MTTLYYPKSRFFILVLLCFRNLAVPSQYIVLNLQFFKKFKGDAHSLCKSKINTPNQQLSETCLFPQSFPIPEKKCTFPFWVLSL